MHAVAVHGASNTFAATLRQGYRATESPAARLLLEGQRFAQIVDASQIDHTTFRTAAEVDGVRTVLFVPLRRDDALLGMIASARREVRPFSDKEIVLLENFAAQAVIAMENARLITETREALEQQTATAEVLQVINASPGDLAPVFDAILEKAHVLCGAPQGGMFLRDGDKFQAVTTRGMPEAFAERLRLGIGSDSPVLKPLLAGEPFVHIRDMAEVDHPMARMAVDIGAARSILAVPLRKDDQLFGMIVAGRRELRPYSDKQIALLQNFAAQAVIAMENARLITETREALEQQTATAEVLQVINASPGDLAPVFDAMLDRAIRLCEAAFGSLWTYDGEFFHAVAVRNVPDALAQFVREPHAAGPNTPLGRVVRTKQRVSIVDLATDDMYRSGDRWTAAPVELGGARSYLAIPLLKDDALVGAFAVSREEVRPFTDKQIALVENFAAQAVIAMENARLITETRERTRDLQESLEYQTAISDVLKVMSGSAFDLAPVLETVVATAVRLCRADQATIYRLEDGEYRWDAAAGQELMPEFARIEREVRIRPGTGTLVGRVALAGETVQILDAWSDPLYEVKEDARLGRIRTLLGVPLLRDGVPIGVIGLARQRVEAYSDKEIELVRTFADQAVIAIENARLLNELRERTDELARSVEELKALSDVGQAVSSTLDVRAVLSTILGRSVALAGAEAGAIFRYRRGARAFRLFEAVGWDERLVGEVRRLDIPETVTGIGEATAQRRPLQIADLTTRPSNPLRDATVAAGYRSVLIVPLVGADRVFGAIVLQRRAVGEFPEATLRLMQTLASQSVLAIQNARLFREIAEKSEQLAEASRHKSQFLANMSHELRTPLNAILGYTELMADGIYGELPPRAAGVLERVQNNGKHLLALINDVLDLAKIEAGQLSLTLDDYAMPDVVRSVVSATEGLANSKGLKFTADIMPGLPTGHGDARRLSQVLLNLVGNAVKFTDAGEVAIAATAEDGHFVLTVRDTGPGIAPEDHGKIFEEFQQVDSSNTRKKGGTGLGLAISKRMVEMQGGSISVASELRHGATFRVTLPIRVEEIPGALTEELMGAA
ncbi:MAG TPA: GAF domain-containing protein [Stellaceae bacterium]|nr:GAF domain-containing protein [Stellaceae bacterium]